MKVRSVEVEEATAAAATGNALLNEVTVPPAMFLFKSDEGIPMICAKRVRDFAQVP